MLKDSIGVDCSFAPNGSVRVRRVQIGGKWQAVGQGRQWLDQYGRHVLVMLPGDEVREILLDPGTLAWRLAKGRGDIQIV
ncbi:MAG: hypothetical protein ACE5E7_06980 [Anaerolineae bacterium]